MPLVHVLSLHVLLIHVLSIQSMFYQSSPVHILSHAAEISNGILVHMV